MFLSIVLFCVAVLLFYGYLSGWNNEKYWKKRGVVFDDRNKFLGPVWEYLISDQAFFKILRDMYKKYPKEPAVAFGSLFTPSIFAKDYKNVQHVMQHDFNSFNHRGIEIQSQDKLADTILLMHGPRWKVMRQSMSPLFTAAKLKNMYQIIDKSASDFIQYLKDNPQYMTADVFGTVNTFCCAAIGAAVFGITTKSIFDSPFLDMARKALQPTFKSNVKFAIILLSNHLASLLNIKMWAEHEDFFIGTIDKVIKQRMADKTTRHDFIDLCIALQKNEVLRDPATGYEIKPTTDILAAQAFFFFIAGVEPSATAIYSVLLELGRHPDILQRVHDEIDETFEKHNGQMTHDIIQDMEYLDKVLSESMRMYPPIGYLIRQCIKDSVLPVGNIRIEKGTQVYTPIFDIHYDEQYFPEPEVFNPDRFNKDGLQTSLSDAPYMPFGKGNRACIGARYARLQVKAGLVHLLRNFSVETIVGPGGVQFKKEQVQVRPTNVNVHFIPRDVKAY